MLKIAYSPVYKYPLPEGHRFPMSKYELIPEQLLYEGTVTEQQFFHPELLPEETLLLTHERAYWEKLKNQTLTEREVRAIGFPMTPRLVERGRHIASGTLECAAHAMKDGVAMNVAGGTHHSFSYRGEGFCVLNDIAIAANALLHRGLVQRILIVDLDVHQGNGTAQIFQNEPRVFTFSMHGEKNYPHRKEQSDLDVALPDGMTDKPYLELLQRHLHVLMEQVQPEFVFYLSGVDVLETDRLGRLSLSIAGCKERDKLVLKTCKSLRIPLAISMGGGYSARLAHVVEAHCNTFRLAQEMFF